MELLGASGASGSLLEILEASGSLWELLGTGTSEGLCEHLAWEPLGASVRLLARLGSGGLWEHLRTSGHILNTSENLYGISVIN